MGPGQTEDRWWNRSRAQFAIALALLVGVAGVLRFHQLDNPSYWSDEMFQIRDAVGLDKPGYIETRFGMQLAGVDVASMEPEGYGDFKAKGLTEFNGRLAAAIIGTLSVAVFALLLVPMIGRGPALATAALLTACTWHIEWSQSARFYSPMFLYYNTALLAYFVASERKSLPLLGLSMAAAWLASAAKPTSLMLFGVIAIDGLVLWLRTRRLPFGVPGLALLAVAFLFCAVFVLPQGTSNLDSFSTRRLGESTARVIAGNVYNLGPAVALMALAGAWMARRQLPRAVTFFVAAVAVPLLSFGVLANFLHVEIRYTFMNVLGWLGLAGLGSGFAFRALREVQGPWVAATPFGLVLIASSLAMLHYYEPASGNRPRWREAYEYVERHRSEGDRIVGLATWAGKYYLADDGVEQLKHGLDSGEDDRRGTWFIVKEPYDRMFAERAVLREVFANRTSYPQDTVRVYYRMAASRELAAAADRD